MDEISVRLGQIQYALRTPMVPAVAYTGPGDVVTSAVAWWGLRAYSGSARGTNAVRIRRASDNAESDFTTASDGTLNRASILTFLSGTDGRIVTLYDQSGNSRPVTQATAANQPIVNCMGMGLSPVLLLHFDGADLSTTFTDSSGRGHVLTRNACEIVTAQSKFGGSSVRFDAAGDYLTVDSSDDLTLGLSDFTIDCWFRLNATGSVQTLIDFRGVGDDISPRLFISSGNVLKYAQASSDQITGTTTLTTATWYHAAVTRSAGSTRLFLNGTQEGSTYSDTNNYLHGSTRPIIGSNTGGSETINGWIDELRIIKGAAAWTGNFTPPTSAYTVADDKVVAEFVAASSHYLAMASNITQSQPFTIDWVAADKSAGATLGTIIGTGTNSVQTGFNITSDNTFVYGGTGVTAANAANIWHAVQAIYISSSSHELNIDGTAAATGNAGGASISTTALYLGSSNGQNWAKASVSEGGLWGSAFSGTQSSDMDSNQRTFWGFGSYTGPGDIV